MDQPIKKGPEVEDGFPKDANWHRSDGEARGYGAARQPSAPAPKVAGKRKETDNYTTTS